MDKKYVPVMMSALIFPGVGQFYSKRPFRGVLYVLMTLVAIGVLFCLIARGLHRALVAVLSSGGGGLWEAMAQELGGSWSAVGIWLVILVLVWAASLIDALYTVINSERSR